MYLFAVKNRVYSIKNFNNTLSNTRIERNFEDLSCRLTGHGSDVRRKSSDMEAEKIIYQIRHGAYVYVQ